MSKQTRKVFVIGVGMTKFEKPGARSWDYPDMAKEAGTKAMLDAGVKYTDIEQAAVGYVYGKPDPNLPVKVTVIYKIFC